MNMNKTSPYTIDPVQAGLAVDTDTEPRAVPQPIIVEPIIAISVQGTPRNAVGSKVGETVVTHTMSLPMPVPQEPSYGFSVDRFGRPRVTEDSDQEPSRKACLVSMQVEEFLLGLGLNLPSRKLASWALRQIQNLKKGRESDRTIYESRISGIEKNATDNITRSRHERDQFAEQARGWQQYAEALEARIERSGCRRWHHPHPGWLGAIALLEDE